MIYTRSPCLSGYRFDELQGKNPRLLKSGTQDLAVYQELWETIAAGNVWRGELVNNRKNGTFYHEEKTITPVRDAYGAITHFIAVSTDISERKWTEDALESLVESMVGVTGMAYLHQVTRSLCEWFQTDGACIGEMIDHERIRAVAMVVDGQLCDGYEYLLCGTPCASVLSQGPVLYEQQAAALFPDDQQLAKLGIQGYAGVPLEDLGGPSQRHLVDHLAGAHAATWQLEGRAADQRRQSSGGDRSPACRGSAAQQVRLP